MFGPSIRNVFKSRWHALAWSVSILITAYCTVPAAEQSQQLAEQHRAAAHHKNPWAKDQTNPDKAG